MAMVSALDDSATDAPKDKLRALGIVALNGMFDEQDSVGVIRQAVELLPDDLAVVSSFGADSAVLLHMIAEVDPTLPVLFLETGKHFAETLDYVETLKARLGLTNVKALTPDQADLQRFDPTGDLWERDPDSCCHIRKTEPLNIAVSGYGGWITGRKRFQTSARGVLPHFELTSDDRIKINPLAYWTNEDIEAYKAAHDLPQHKLFDQGYKSIGCAPCTSAVAEGEDPRSGRWRGFNKTECGIHFDFNGQIAKPVIAKDPTLFRDGQFIADPWRDWADEDSPEQVRYTHVPLPVYLERREEFSGNPHPLGLLVSPGDRIEEVADELGRFASIAVAFPSFTDGRGYSTARLLTERYGFEGELRAVGDVLTDQVQFLWRCGFNALAITNPVTRKALQDGAAESMSVFMQPVAARREAPAGTRPYLRRPVKESA